MTSIAVQESSLSIRDEGKQFITIKSNHLKKASMIIRALNHGLRQKIVRLVEEHGRLTVTEIYVKLRLEQSVASQQLAILRNAGILITEREGKYIYYSVNVPRIKNIQSFIDDIINF